MTGSDRRVVHVASAREWRGGQRQVLLLTRGLARLGVDQLVVTGRGSRLEAELIRAGITVAAVGWDRGIGLGPIRGARRAARLTKSLWHAHDSHALLAAGVWRALGSGTPLVATRRTDRSPRRPGFWARADRVVAISEAVRRALETGGIPPNRIVVIPDGVELDSGPVVGPESVRRSFGLPETGPLAVHVGALTAEKDQRTLIRAAAAARASSPTLHWAIAGSGPLRDDLAALARDLGVAHVIHFLGWVEDPRALIRSGDVFVMSSAHEGLGSSILDAMALGRPVVATAAGGIPELLDGGVGTVVPIGAADRLAAAVEAMLLHPDLRVNQVKAGLRKVQEFTADGMARKALQVYRSLAL